MFLSVCLFVVWRGGGGGFKVEKENEKFFLKKLPCLKMGIQVFIQIDSLGKWS